MNKEKALWTIKFILMGRVLLSVLFSDILYPNTHNIIEAMAIGLPCISTDCPCGGPGELINNGENGLLVPVGDTAALSDALKKLVDNPQLSEKIQKNAPSIRERLDSDLIGKAWLDYLENT